MTNLDPGDFNIGDIVRVAFSDKSAVLDCLVKADTAPSKPAIEEQSRAPTDNERAEIEELAVEAGQLQDELKAAIGDKQRRLSSLKDQLKGKMIHHGLSQISVSGRPPIELTESSSRKPTRKAIAEVLEAAAVKRLTEGQRRDPKQLKKARDEGRMKALNLWNAIEQTTSRSLKIPDPAPPEIDSPY